MVIPVFHVTRSIRPLFPVRAGFTSPRAFVRPSILLRLFGRTDTQTAFRRLVLSSRSSLSRRSGLTGRPPLWLALNVLRLQNLPGCGLKKRFGKLCLPLSNKPLAVWTTSWPRSFRKKSTFPTLRPASDFSDCICYSVWRTGFPSSRGSSTRDEYV